MYSSIVKSLSFVLVQFFLSSTIALSQTNKSEAEENTFVIVDEMPAYKHGGDKGMFKFIKKNRRELSKPVNGMVYVLFTINSKGEVLDPSVIKGLSSEADAEAIRLVRLLEFTPGRSLGEPVDVKYNLPIKFGKR